VVLLLIWRAVAIPLFYPVPEGCADAQECCIAFPVTMRESWATRRVTLLRLVKEEVYKAFSCAELWLRLWVKRF